MVEGVGMAKDSETANQELCQTLGKRLGAWKTFVVQELPAGIREASVDSLALTIPVACNDLKALARQARGAGRPLVVRNTATWAGCAAIRLGAHLSYEHLADDLLLVGLSKDAESVLPGMVEKMVQLATPPDKECHKILDELPKFEAAWHSASDTAQVVATYLACHPRVTTVRYPGLKADPSFAIAARTLVGGFGPTVDYLCEADGHWHRVSYGAGVDPREAVITLEQALEAMGS